MMQVPSAAQKRLYTLLLLLFTFLPALLTGAPKPTSLYTLKVNGKEVKVYDCRVSAVPINQVWPGYQRPLEQTEVAYFAYVDMPAADTKIEIQISCKNKVNTVEVSPKAEGLRAVVKGKDITFQVSKAGPVVVEVNGERRALHLFVNPPEENRPDPSAQGLMYFGPGEHTTGLTKLQSNQSVYIAPGAVVYGSFYAINASNIRIYGRGIIDLSRMERGTSSAAGFSGCTNVSVEGVIMRDPSMWTCTFFGCKNVNVSNIKLIGLWRYNADGIDIVNSSDVTVKDCFVRSYDDGIVIKGMKENLGEPERLLISHNPVNNVNISGCVIMCDWGNAFEIGAETSAPHISNITYKNCDIIKTTHTAMDILHGDGASIKNIRYEDIRVNVRKHNPAPVFQTYKGQVYADEKNDSYSPLLFQFRIEKNMWVQDNLLGSIDGVVFKNVSVTGPHKMLSSFKGADADHTASNITIDNLRFNGEHIKTARQAGLTIGTFVNNVQFK